MSEIYPKLTEKTPERYYLFCLLWRDFVYRSSVSVADLKQQIAG